MDCCSSGSSDGKPSSCPRCGRSGRGVERLTLKALLRPSALERLQPGDYSFCSHPGCDVVYFGPGLAFERDDVTVPVFQKEPPGNRTVCYCLDIGEADLRREAAGAPFARISQLVKAGQCACELRNPQGSCCLGNITLVTSALRAPTLESGTTTGAV